MNYYNWSEKQIQSVIDGTFMASDGGGYGIKIIGYDHKKSEFISIHVGADGKLANPNKEYRISYFKASCRYKLPLTKRNS